MLLLSDCPTSSGKIHGSLRQLEPCRLVALEDAGKVHPTHLIIACHMSAADASTRHLLVQAIDRHRLSKQVPLLFFVSSDQIATAVQFGADEIAGYELDDDGVRQAVRNARAKARTRNGSAPASPAPLASDVGRVGRSLHSVFSAARSGSAMPRQVLADGAEALVAMARRAKVRDWVDLVRSFDDATYQHCLLVAGLIADFSARLSLTLPQQHALSQAALIHDLGKVGVPSHILNKPGALTETERRIMAMHPSIGHDLLVRQSFNDALCLDVVKHHHECLDGTGYPDRLRGSQISESVRITTICDIFAALIERRPYRAPKSAENAYSDLTQLGMKLDQGLMRDFKALAQALN